ncbi:hypothetical protein JCM21900_000185 [Sporobolomyces salmonicolor]
MVAGFSGPAKLCLVDRLPPATPLDPPRLRLVARVVATRLQESLILVADGQDGLVVDIELAVRGGAIPPRVKDLVMLTGELCLADPPTPIPSIATARSSPAVDPSRVLKATNLVPCEELDMDEWRAAVRAVQQHAAR